MKRKTEAGAPPSRRLKSGGEETSPLEKKRKHRSVDTDEKVREDKKSTRMCQSDRESESEVGLPWNNLQLILSLQDKNIDLLKKVDIAFDYVKSSSTGKMDDMSRHTQLMSTSRTIDFMNNWVQSILISSEKKMRFEEKKPESEASASVLDLRCWKIFHFCLEESKHFCVSLTCSRDFLRVIHSIATDASSCVDNISLCCEGTISGDRLQLYDAALDCISLVFSFHGGVANENLDLWILLMDKVLELTLKIVTRQLEGSKLGNTVLQLSCYLFEPFANFLRVHPTRKNNFHGFIDKLLAPLLHLLHVLHSSSCSSNIDRRINLPNLVGEVLAQGLFHPTHIDGFLSLQSTVRYRNSSDATVKEEKLVNKSYHRHLFDKVEKIIADKNGLALIGLGELLHLFVSSVTKHKEVLVCRGGSKQFDVSSASYVPNNFPQSSTVTSEKIPECKSMDADLRKSIFDYFVQTMEYLLEDLNKYLQSDGEAVSLFNVSITLRSISNLLANFIIDKLYLRTEDKTEGASGNFLRLIYVRVMSIFAKISHQKASSFGSDEKSQSELYISIRKDLIVTVHYLLNIDYEVVGDDPESLWTMIFSSVACCYSSMDVLGQPLLFSEIISLGCKLIDLYSELRQVDSSIFSLCRALRHSLSLNGESETYTPLPSCSTYSNALSMLLCSSKFRISLTNAIEAIPEGRASGCIQQLSSDIKESLEWIKCGHQLAGLGEIEKSNPHSCDVLQFHLRAELLGKVLSEVYITILDSITVTSGNSYLVGGSLKNLLEVIRPILSSLVSRQRDSSNEICFLVDGRILSKSSGCDNASICWILVAFLRLVLYSRSLFRQAISLMPPGASKKMSRVMGDSFIISCGNNRVKMTDSATEGFFSWINEHSATVLNVIHSNSDICIQDSAVLCSPLVYVLNSMALQRLVDLNRLIQSSGYTHNWNQTQDETKLKDVTDLSPYHERLMKHEECDTEMRKEAAGLTEFMMGFLPSIAKDLTSALLFDSGTDDTLVQRSHSNDALDFSVGSLDEKSSPYTLWWIMCKNVDVWCSHAAKNDLKNFLTVLIQASLLCIDEYNGHSRSHNMSNPLHLKKVTANQIALEVLSNTALYKQRFVRRYMASRFCRILQKSVVSIFATSEVDLSKPPDWVEVTSALEKLSDVRVGALTWRTPNREPGESCNEQINVEFARCQRLLTFLMWMPEDLSSKSSSLYITCILNLERVLVGFLLDWPGESCSHNPYQIIRLFVTCRRVLHTLASREANVNGSQSLVASKLPKCSLPLPWLLKSLSVVAGFQHAFPEDKGAIFSLLDDTCKVLLIVSKDQFNHEIGSIVSARKIRRERKNLDTGTIEPDIPECDLQLNPEENSVAWRSVLQLAEILKESLQKGLTTFRDESLDIEHLARCQDLNKLSSTIACFQGILWGLASTIAEPNAINSNLRIKLSHNTELMTRIKSWVDTCTDFVSYFLKPLYLEDDPTPNMSTYGGSAFGGRESSSGSYDRLSYASNEGHPSGKVVSSDIKADLIKCNLKRKTCSAIRDLEAFLSEVNCWKLCLKKSLLMQVFRGENTEAAFFFRQLFIAFSAILRLNVQIDITPLSWSSFPVLVDISQLLVSEFSRSEMPHQSVFFLLDGVVKFLDQLGSYFPRFDPSFSKDFYVKLIGLHLRVIGKCISLQGKEAKLVSQETGSQAERLADQVQPCGSRETRQFGECKERWRMSFRKYIEKSSDLHLLSAIQTIERALVGVQEGLMTNYELVCGSSNGEVSSFMAAGIDCLDSILYFIRGRRRLNIIKRNIQNLVACLFNVILHLQGPSIFYGFVDSIKAYDRPDPGSVILMCIELLTKLSGKSSSFQIDGCHIMQSVRVPGALFQYLLQHQNSGNPVKVDWKFSINLYDASCRMLCTALKHHKSETWKCIAVLEDSVSVLLHCLEVVNIQFAGRDSFAWEVQQAVKCANSLQRVYEEIGQQKDVFGQCAFQFLSRYISVYCGLGPTKNGIIREVDQALKQGVYALIDACSADDLQLLHTVFGEGPCRNTLADLQHDYKLHQYQGKV